MESVLAGGWKHRAKNCSVLGNESSAAAAGVWNRLQGSGGRYGLVWCGASKTTNTLGSGIKPLGYREEKTVWNVFQVVGVALHFVGSL